MGSSSSQVAVVGAGIAGLAAAVALHRAGVDVRVYEQADALGEVGAGIALSSNTVEFLDHVGLLPRLEQHAVPVHEGMVTYLHDGTRVSATGYTGGRGVHRADLVDTLASALPEGTVKLGKKLHGFRQDDETVTLEFGDGDNARAAAVIGADGIHSIIRNRVADPAPPTFSGVVAYRGLVPTGRVPGWRLDEARLFIGKHRHFLTFPVRRGTLVNFVGYVAADEEMRESWSASGDPAVLAAEFQEWNDEVRGFISQIEHTWRWGLHDHEPLTNWTVGRVTLAGDAAHAMLPHAAQGANQSFEDAIALAEVLRDRDPSDYPAALDDYQRARLARAAFVQLYTRRLGLIWDGHTDGIDQRTDLADRDEVTRWIYQHDVRDAVRRAREDGQQVGVPAGLPA